MAPSFLAPGQLPGLSMPDGGRSQCLPSELGCVEGAPRPRPLPEVALPVLACGPRGILGRLCHHTRHPCHPGDSSVVGWQSSMREPLKIPCEMGTVCCSNALGPGGCGGFSCGPFPLVFKAKTPYLLLADSLGPGLQSGGGESWGAEPPRIWQAHTLPTSPAHPIRMFFFSNQLSPKLEFINLNVIISGPGSQPHSP